MRVAQAADAIVLGRSLPILSTECGYLVGEDTDPRYPATTPDLHMAQTLEACRVMMGTSQRFKPAPDYYFCTAFWLLANQQLGSSSTWWESNAWYSERWPNGVLPVVRALQAEPKVARPEDVEVPTSWFLGGLVISGAGVVLVAWRYFSVPPHYGVLAVAMTFVLGLVACRATGESDITPGGAMGKIMQLTYGALIPRNSTANLMTAAITSGSSLAAADLLNDLKSGYLLGANPRRQFLAQAAGILTGTIATTIGYFVLVPDATALTGTAGKDPAFPAPGAQQWKAVAEVMKYGFGNMHPMSLKAFKIALVVGVILALAEGLAPKKWKKYLPSPTGLGLGMTLPFFFPLAMFLGAVFALVAGRVNKSWAERYIVPIAAGGIAGESIVGVVVQALNNFVLH